MPGFLSRLHEDVDARSLRDTTTADIELGRAAPMVPADSLNLEDMLLVRRYRREQGVRFAGALNTRSVDEDSGNRVNFCVPLQERLQCDPMDQMIELLQAGVAVTPSHTIELSKADIDVAHRMIPVTEAQRRFLWFRWLEIGPAYASRHKRMPFGCTGLVLRAGQRGQNLKPCVSCPT